MVSILTMSGIIAVILTLFNVAVSQEQFNIFINLGVFVGIFIFVFGSMTFCNLIFLGIKRIVFRKVKKV